MCIEVRQRECKMSLLSLDSEQNWFSFRIIQGALSNPIAVSSDVNILIKNISQKLAADFILNIRKYIQDYGEFFCDFDETIGAFRQMAMGIISELVPATTDEESLMDAVYLLQLRGNKYLEILQEERIKSSITVQKISLN